MVRPFGTASHLYEDYFDSIPDSKAAIGIVKMPPGLDELRWAA